MAPLLDRFLSRPRGRSRRRRQVVVGGRPEGAEGLCRPAPTWTRGEFFRATFARPPNVAANNQSQFGEFVSWRRQRQRRVAAVATRTRVGRVASARRFVAAPARACVRQLLHGKRALTHTERDALIGTWNVDPVGVAGRSLSGACKWRRRRRQEEEAAAGRPAGRPNDWQLLRSCDWAGKQSAIDDSNLAESRAPARQGGGGGGGSGDYDSDVPLAAPRRAPREI